MAGLMALVPDLLARVANLLDVDDKAAFRASCKGPMEAVFDSTTALTWRGRKADQLQSPTDHYMNALSEEGMVMLGKCPRLHKLVISSMRVADLAPLSTLTGLTSLECPRCMGDLAPLAGLTQLQSLCIGPSLRCGGSGPASRPHSAAAL